MSDYRLEELGWAQFQRVCDLVLERELDIPAESWSGDCDDARVARVDGTLVVVLWAREVVGVHSRIATAISERRHPTELVVVCSLDVGPAARSAAADFGIPARKVAVLGPYELSAALDDAPDVRCALPSVLGVRWLGGVVDPAVLERSTLDVDAAGRLAKVFVTTRAYARALRGVRRHHFVVLTGPPEMGKTAIARMLGLAHLTCGREAHECTSPAELWERFDPRRPQLFVADDAFGSTEYRPDAADRWARELDRILGRLDADHWLIWTSRPAPLKAGLRQLHRVRGLERFPAPGEVEVDASALDAEEKALILFRHARAAGLDAAAIALVQDVGARIVADPHFTPERIRRLVGHRLPHVVQDYATASPEILAAALAAELTEPTAAMTASFRALEPQHRALLVAMLDAPPAPVHEHDLAAALRRHSDAGLSESPHDLVDRLSDHFLRAV